MVESWPTGKAQPPDGGYTGYRIMGSRFAGKQTCSSNTGNAGGGWGHACRNMGYENNDETVRISVNVKDFMGGPDEDVEGMR